MTSPGSVRAAPPGRFVRFSWMWRWAAGLQARVPMPRRLVIGNLGARFFALASVAVVTVLVARAGGADEVGLLALMRVLPGLAGVIAACGLPGAMGYFVAGPHASHRGLWPTIGALMAAGAVIGTGAWLAVTPIIHSTLMATTTLAVVAATGVTVATQLPVAVGKACLQALGDSRGANVATAAEEAAFVPAFAVGWAVGLRGGWLLVAALLVADVVVAWGAWIRIRHQIAAQCCDDAAGSPARTPRGVGGVDRQLAWHMVRFGLRGQVGGVVGLLNLRLDVVLLGAFAGPAPVGVYVVASKYAELLRLPGLSLTWVVYPEVARAGAQAFPATVRRWLPRLLLVGVVCGVLLGGMAFPLLPVVYGSEFQSAVWPAAWISLGLIAGPAAGLASGYLTGAGRPGLNSTVLGVGLLLTVVLDLLLIPAHGSLGAAWASATAYLCVDVILIATMLSHVRRQP